MLPRVRLVLFDQATDPGIAVRAINRSPCNVAAAPPTRLQDWTEREQIAPILHDGGNAACILQTCAACDVVDLSLISGAAEAKRSSVGPS